jgi:hypothetical protein
VVSQIAAVQVWIGIADDNNPDNTIVQVRVTWSALNCYNLFKFDDFVAQKALKEVVTVV